MPDQPTIEQLVERFYNDQQRRLPTYNETEARVQYINPLFRALGWDVDNIRGRGEVRHEDTVTIGGKAKAPDYGFYLDNRRRFFVEAKKPAVNLDQDVAPAYQLRRYGWTAKLPLSILTDFQEFAVYDTRVRPHAGDNPKVARTRYWTYKEYPDVWDEIASVFSREAVLSGSLEQYAAEQGGKKGVATVDAEFLREIERWRELLARNIALRNPGLDERGLNFAVQQTIDRLLFLRIAEDRGIEPYGRLQGLLKGGDLYSRLFAFFNQADARYNSGLFHFAPERGRGDPDLLTPRLNIDDKALKEIIGNLYAPASPYEFSVFPADILGQVYEQFLGKVIRLTGKSAKVEEKPEVRKAGGVYYTPTYIVEYIVRQTVGKLVEGHAPDPTGPVSRVRVLDPACGSGSFLLGAYAYLLDWHLRGYLTDAGKWSKGRNKTLHRTAAGEYHLTLAERKRILLDNLYGVDIDPQAVEVTKLSLLLKALEETPDALSGQLALLPERVLPDLDNNIKCGNSLIGPDFYAQGQLALFDREEQLRINAFDWQAEFRDVMSAGGFDAVIGNPPYDVLEKDRLKSSWPHSALTEYVRIHRRFEPALGGKLNLFRFFLVQSLQLLKNYGRFGMIVPLSLLADISCAATRQYVLETLSNVQADCFPQKDDPKRRVFLSAKLSTTIIVGEKGGSTSEPQIKVRTYPANSFDDEHREATITKSQTMLLDPKNLPIPLVDEETWSLCLRIHSNDRVKRLGTLDDFEVRRGEINQTIYREFIGKNDKLTRMVKGVEIGQYVQRQRLSQGYREWFDEEGYIKQKREQHPLAYKRRIATQRITGVDERLRVVATIVESVAYFADSTNSISLKEGSIYPLEYILGLLNSTLCQWRFKLTSTNNNVGTNELNTLPIRTIDFSDAADAARHDQMVTLVQRMLDLHKELAAEQNPQVKTVLQRQIEATDAQIDRLVYELYGLSEEEIAIVEGRSS